MTKQQAGQLGGLSTFKKYGKSHMRNIGAQGAKVTWSRYSLKPVGTSNYAMVNRETGEIKAVLNSASFSWQM